MTAPIERWGKIDEEGHTGFRISTSNGLRDYNAHSSGLVSVSVLIELTKVTVSFHNSEGRLVHHVYAVQGKF